MTLKDIEKRIIGYTSTTKNMSGVIVPIQNDGEFCAFYDDYGDGVLQYDTCYSVDNAHNFVKTHIVDFIINIDENENIYYLFIPNYETDYVDDILWEVINYLDEHYYNYKKYRQLYKFLKPYKDKYDSISCYDD